MIKILSLCAALLAPPSSGVDPHGRSAHLKYYTDFNTAYKACIATAGKAQSLGLDVFTTLAMTHKLVGFSPKHAERKKISRKLFREYSCQPRRRDYYVRDSCSPYMLLPQRLYDILNDHTHVRVRYNTAICYLVTGNMYCGRKSRRLARRIKNMTRRFVDVYRRTHRYYNWSDPYIVRPPSHRYDRYHNYNDPHIGDRNGWEINDLLRELSTPQRGY